MQEREVAASTFPYENTFMGVPVGRPLVYIDSRGRVGIAVNQGNFSKKYGVTPPLLIFIPHKVESNPELSSLRKKVHRYSSLPLTPRSRTMEAWSKRRELFTEPQPESALGRRRGIPLSQEQGVVSPNPVAQASKRRIPPDSTRRN